MKKVLKLLAILIAFSFTTVNAKELDSNKEVVKAGKEVNISLDFDSDKVVLDYDQNIFEEIDEASFEVDDDLISTKGNTFYFSKDKSDTIELTLKVKDDAISGNTTIKVTHDGIVDKINYEIDGESLKSSSIWLIPGLLALGIVIFMACYYIKTKDDFESKQLSVMVVSGILTVALVITAVVLSNRKETPEKDDNEYLIEVKDSENEETDEVTVTQIEENVANNEKTDTNKMVSNSANTKQEVVNIVYSASVNSYLSNTEIIKKGDNIIITFSADVNPYAEISAVEINGTIYPVTKVDDKYQVTIKADGKYGNRNYTITSIILTNGKQINVSEKTADIYILKDEPTIENVKINSREATPVLTFDVKDPENAFISGTVLMTSKTSSIARTIALDNDTEILNENNVNVGENSYTLPNLTEGMDYDLVITLNYDIDEDKTDSKYSSELKDEETVKFEREYNFKLQDVTYPAKVYNDTDLTFTFKNGEFSYRDVTEITIDGTIYTVTKDENGVYRLNDSLTKCSEKGKCQINVQSVKIIQDNDAVKTIDVNESFEYIYMKNAPTVENFEPVLDSKELRANFKISDSDNTIVDGKVILSKDGKEYSYNLTKEQLKGSSFTIENVELPKAGEYDVTLVVNYDLGDGEKLSLNEASREKVREKITAKITNVTGNEKIVTRGEKIDLYYTIESNTDIDITNITINNEVISGEDLQKQSDGTYKVTITVPTDSNKEVDDFTRNITASKITYGNEEITLESALTTVVNIFKSVPTIDSLTLSASGGQISGQFTYTDKDGAVEGAEYTIGNETYTLSPEDLAARKFKNDEEREANDYIVTLTLIYDLGDGNKLEDVTKQKQIEVDVNADITDVSIEPKFVSKGGNVTITYTVKDNTSSTLSAITVNGNNIENPTSLGNDKYQVTMKIDETEKAGFKNITATKLTYENGKTFDLNKEATVTVLKDMPTIGTFTATYENNKLTGNVSVVEKTPGEITVQSGKLTITGPGLTEYINIELSADDIMSGKFTKDLELTKMGDYDVALEITYNLGEKDITTEAQHVTINQKLKASIKSMNTSKTVNKGGDIKLNFQIEDNTDEQVSNIIINGEQKNVVYHEETNTYTVDINAGHEAKLLTFVANGLVYTKAGSIDTDPKQVEVYVIKDLPVIDGTPTYTDKDVTIKITDNDKAKTTGRIIFTKVGEDTPQQMELLFDEMESTATAAINTLPNGAYNIIIEINYDLDGETLDLPEFKNKVIEKYENVSIITNYDPINVSELSVNSFTDNNDIVLDFTATNGANANISEVEINGKFYKVNSASNNKYTVTIDNPNIRKELQITNIKFDTGIIKEISTSPKVIVNKTAPTATITTSLDENKKHISATITTTDNDTTIDKEHYSAILRNEDTEEDIETLPISDGNKVDFKTSIDGKTRYVVKVVANYDLVDGKTYNDVTLATSDAIVTDAIVEFESTSMLTPYTHPGSVSFTVYLNLESNVKIKGSDISNVKIQTDEYEAKDNYEPVGIESKTETYNKVNCFDSVKEGDLYKTKCNVNYKVPSKSGVVKLKILSYKYLEEDKTVSDKPNENLVDITKWSPNITYKVINDYSKKQVQVKFTIYDPNNMLQQFDDGSYLKASFGTIESKTKISNVNSGSEQTIVFENIDDKFLNKGIRINIKARYDMYHGDIVNKASNRVEDISVINCIHFFTKENELSLNNIELVSSDGHDIGGNEFKQGDQVKLSFQIEGTIPEHPDFKATKIVISTSDPKNSNYKKEYNVTQDENGVYTTDDVLSGLNPGNQYLTIVSVSDNNTTIKTTKDNVINIIVDSDDPVAVSLAKSKEKIQSFYNEVAILPDDSNEEENDEQPSDELDEEENMDEENETFESEVNSDDEVYMESSENENMENEEEVTTEPEITQHEMKEATPNIQEKNYSNDDLIPSNIIIFKKNIESTDPGIIWWAEFKCDMTMCEGFNGHASQGKVSSTLEGRRADIEFITMEAPNAKDGYKFVGWKKYTVTYSDVEIQGFEAVYEAI